MRFGNRITIPRHAFQVKFNCLLYLAFNFIPSSTSRYTAL